MTEILVVIVLGLAVIAAATLLGPRLGIASPLVLVAIGVAASFLPIFDGFTLDPELILTGVLPPLLYSAAVSMPSMNFRREFGAISGLSVVLVVATSLVLGVFFMLVLPDLGFAWGVALGAIISPTDAVAVSIVRGTSVSKRVVAMLDGESLLNDATALVLLRTAIVAAAAAFSFWSAVGTFAFSVVVAIVIGLLASAINLSIRKRITDATVNTVISFTVPFLAAVPAELLGASGLVAAVVAGLVTGVRAPRDLSPQNRLSDAQNWRTVELVLEGAVFLTMGLQIKSIVTAVEVDHAGVGPAVLIAAGALAITILVRAAYIAPLLAVLSAASRRTATMHERLTQMQGRMTTPEGIQDTYDDLNRRRAEKFPRAEGRLRQRTERDLERFARRVTQGIADIEYFRRAPLGWRDGTAVVWAGMRGAVTVAAAQTLPDDTPLRSVLVLIAFAVAVLSLGIQGGTLAPLLRRIAPKVDQATVHARTDEERSRLMQLMRDAGSDVPEPEPLEGPPSREQYLTQQRYQLELIAAQRKALLDARDNGTFDADVLEKALDDLDASEIALARRG